MSLTASDEQYALSNYLAGTSVQAIATALETDQTTVSDYLTGLGLTVFTSTGGNVPYVIFIRYDESAGLLQRDFQYPVASDTKAHAESVLASLLSYQNQPSYTVLYVIDASTGAVV